MRHGIMINYPTQEALVQTKSQEIYRAKRTRIASQHSIITFASASTSHHHPPSRRVDLRNGTQLFTGYRLIRGFAYKLPVAILINFLQNVSLNAIGGPTTNAAIG